MILADKIIALRKKNGWSQEELAEKMSVTRQSVSKWEGAQSVPDLQKVLQMADIFGVSTDYLLKDELEEAEYVASTDEGTKVRRVSMEEANEFLRVKEITSKRIAFGTFLCILSPITIMLLGAASETGTLNITENVAGGIGLIVLLLLVAAAVAVFISSGSMTSHFAYLEEEEFETEYGVSGMVKERQKQRKDTYTRGNVLGTCICILSVIPLFATAFMPENEMLAILLFSLMLLLVGIAVFLFIRVGIPWASMQKLLQEGDYTKVEKKKRKRSYSKVIGPVYWPLVTAGFLACIFLVRDWEYSWVIWPVAAVLYVAIVNAANAFHKDEE